MHTSDYFNYCLVEYIYKVSGLKDAAYPLSWCATPYTPFRKGWALALESSRVWRFCGTQCSAARFEPWKRVQKGTSTGVWTANVLLCKWSAWPGFPWFCQIQCFGGKTSPKSYSCYGLLFGEIDIKNTIGRAFHGISKKTETKTQNLTRLWPKARISTFS